MNKFWKIEDFHQSRERCIGASDIPTLAGLNKKYNQTPLTLWEQKTKREEGFKGNSATYWGHKLEPLVLHEFIKQFYSEELQTNQLMSEELERLVDAHARNDHLFGPFKILTEAKHPDYQFTVAHADLLSLVDPENPFLVDAKTGNYFSGKKGLDIDFGYSEDDLSEQGIPSAAYLQMQYQMMCYGVDTSYVAALINTSDFRIYGPIKAKKDIQEKCLTLAARFFDHLNDDTPPEPIIKEDVFKLFPNLKNETKVISNEDLVLALDAISERKKMKLQIKKLENKIEDIDDALHLLAGENTIVNDPEGNKIIKISNYQTKRIKGLKEIEKNYPEIYEAIVENNLINESITRRLNV